jgi:hypothetical protein
MDAQRHGQAAAEQGAPEGTSEQAAHRQDGEAAVSLRRRWLQTLVQGSVGMLVLAGCGTTRFFAGKSRPLNGDGGDQGDADNVATEPTSGEGPAAVVLCTPPAPETIPDADASLTPEFKLYGQRSSALLALLFPDGAQFTEFRLLRGDGSPVYFRRLNAADRIGDKFRPIVIDNISLGRHESWQLLLTREDGSIRKCVHPVQFFNEYEGMPVLDLGQRSIPNGFLGNQSVPQFGQGALAGFNSDANVTYPDANGGPGARTLLTATATSTWTKGAGVLGITTDIMGRSIDIDGESGLSDYPLFCTYQLSGNTYVRTMLRVG